MPIIALTGAMGCGKSAAKAIFEKYGFQIFDTDSLAKNLLNEKDVKKEVKELLGSDVFDENDNFIAKKIADKVFANKELLASYEAILHPKVIQQIRNLSQNNSDKNSNIIIEVPLLFEKKLENEFNLCITVFCSKEIRYQRLQNKGLNPIRDTYQFSAEKKADLADVVLLNETNLQFLERQIVRFLLDLDNGRKFRKYPIRREKTSRA